MEYEGYCRLTRVEEIMTFARKMGYKKLGIAYCIGLVNEARIFARILRANGFEAVSYTHLETTDSQSDHKTLAAMA